MNEFPKLETRRLLLREIVPADASALLAVFGEDTSAHTTPGEKEAARARAEVMIRGIQAANRAPNPATRWALERKDRPGIVGICGFLAWDRPAKRASVAFNLLSDEGGNGYLTEAMMAVLGYGFRTMELNRVEAQIHPGNSSGRTLLRKLGFIEEGIMREAANVNGQAYDLVMMSLLKREFTPST